MKLCCSLVVLTVILGSTGIFGLVNCARAEQTDVPWVSKIVSVQGRVSVKRPGDSEWQSVRLNESLFAGDQIRVDANSRAGIMLRNDAVVRLDQNTTLEFTEIEKDTTFIIKLLKGAANFFSRRPRSLKILTPFVNGVVEGTEFYLQVDQDQTRIDLFEGRIVVSNAHGSLHLSPGQGANAMAGSAPKAHLLVHPRDSVQWALYYPPVLALGPDDMPAGVDASLKAYRRGRSLEALNKLNLVPETEQGAVFFSYRAALRLHLGRVSQAQEDIRQSLELKPDNGEALALQAIIAMVQNRRADASAVARKAVSLNPASAAAHLALSYAHQAAFDLAGALKEAQAAVTQAPENGTARARLAELWLSTGELDSGIEAARKAVALNPDASHAHTLLGFAFLTQIKIDSARVSFEKAIQLDSAAPLARLGLGLAEIRGGDLIQGRKEIEIAAGLDPANAMMRSYLGKAYFDEKRGPLDEKQFEIAKTLDPNDPTPWLYDAIRKQGINRPVQALEDLQTSIELNDNRAIYRSRLQLDEDLATRSASLGRIFNDLDFQHLALAEGYKSLGRDSTNYSAHRLLADNFAAKPRHEIARVSELLQAQLLQPLNLTPVQARLAETKTTFFEGAGPASLSFNEFNPLFTRNRASIQAGGIVGGNDTWGHEVTGSGILNNISASMGEFHYQTEGFRDNNDDTQDIIDFFLQGSLTPETSLQMEVRNSVREYGDLSQNFDGLFSSIRNKIELTTHRIGVRHEFSSNFGMIASDIFSDSTYEGRNEYSGFPATLSEEIDGNLCEVRTDYTGNRFGLITGFSYMSGTIHEDQKLIPMPGFELPLRDDIADFRKQNLYAYSNWKLADFATLTIGVSGASMKVGSQIERNQFNPKLGLTLQPFQHTTLRLAGFRVLSSTYLTSQTVEPTMVAGFNQFFDDLDASDVKSYGAAIDQKFTRRLFGGVEYLRRDIEAPQFLISTTVRADFFDWQEQTGLAYIYWAPFDIMALRAEYQYEHFDRKDNPMGLGIVDIDTYRVPLSIRLFHPSGLSFFLVTTYYHQDGEFEATGSGPRFSGSDHFWIFDAEVSYRLPKRWGLVSVSVKNLFDEEFRYQDTDPSHPAVVPGFLALGKITLSF